MNLVEKLKHIMSNGGCVKSAKEIQCIETIKDALDIMKNLGKKDIGQARREIASVVNQTIHWIDMLQKDVDIIKGDKVRSILADITALRGDIANIIKELENIKSSSESVKVTKSKKSTEKKDGNQ